jgi:hypothetical protein
MNASMLAIMKSRMETDPAFAAWVEVSRCQWEAIRCVHTGRKAEVEAYLYRIIELTPYGIGKFDTAPEKQARGIQKIADLVRDIAKLAYGWNTDSYNEVAERLGALERHANELASQTA